MFKNKPRERNQALNYLMITFNFPKLNFCLFNKVQTLNEKIIYLHTAKSTNGDVLNVDIIRTYPKDDMCFGRNVQILLT